MEISLKQHLKNMGWDKRFLSRDGCLARINYFNYTTCFEPIVRWRRLYIKPLPLDEVFPEGMKIKFLKSFKHETLETRYFILWLMRIYYWLIKGLDPNKFLTMSVFEGYVNEDGFANHPPFSEFPWDQFLCMERVDDSKMLCKQEDGKIWHISLIPLTSITKIEILVDDKYSAYSQSDTNPTHWIPKYMHVPVDKATRNWLTRIALACLFSPIALGLGGAVFKIWVPDLVPGSPLYGLLMALGWGLVFLFYLPIGAFFWKMPSHVGVYIGTYICLVIENPYIRIIFWGAVILGFFYYVKF